MICYDFGYDLINTITEGDGMKVIEGARVVRFWMSEMKVELKALYIRPEILHSSMTLRRSSPRISKKSI